MASAGYDPKKSRVSDSTMGEWMRSPVNGDLEQVPGIGPGTAKKLKEGEEPITNTYQLIGKFLSLKGPDTDERKVETIEHTDKFWYFLQQVGISAHRSAIVKAIAEKVNNFIPGIYSAEEFEDNSEDEEEEDEGNEK